MNTKDLPKSVGAWTIPIITVIVGFSSLGIFLLVRPSANSQPTTPVSTPSTTAQPNAVAALGRLEPQGGVIKVAAPSSMGSTRISQLLVKEGGSVQAGQVMAVMDTSDRLYAAWIQAQAQVNEAQSRLAQVQAGAKRGDIGAAAARVARLEAELRQAQREYQRYWSLYQNGAISESDLKTRQLTVETAARQLEQARQELSSVAEVRPTEVQQAQAQVDSAIANLQHAKAELENALVRAPIAGQVIKIHADPGEQVGNDGILDLGNTNQMYAVAEIYETDIGKVRVGQTATISSNAFAGTISGKVDQIGLQIRKNDVLNTDPAAATDTRVVEVKIRLNESAKIAGLTNLQVKVEILSE